ncbi:MAG: hypothetical protein B7733_05965 [Myxococcales bacterium FL481]|nr:MAG: hypothetical protein B7733_05965 [Myxococcales bacterium FL481]
MLVFLSTLVPVITLLVLDLAGKTPSGPLLAALGTFSTGAAIKSLTNFRRETDQRKHNKG